MPTLHFPGSRGVEHGVSLWRRVPWFGSSALGVGSVRGRRHRVQKSRWCCRLEMPRLWYPRRARCVLSQRVEMRRSPFFILDYVTCKLETDWLKNIWKRAGYSQNNLRTLKLYISEKAEQIYRICKYFQLDGLFIVHTSHDNISQRQFRKQTYTITVTSHYRSPHVENLGCKMWGHWDRSSIEVRTAIPNSPLDHVNRIVFPSS